jgi:hypothetical protein
MFMARELPAFITRDAQHDEILSTHRTEDSQFPA